MNGYNGFNADMMLINYRREYMYILTYIMLSALSSALSFTELVNMYMRKCQVYPLHRKSIMPPL